MSIHVPSPGVVVADLENVVSQAPVSKPTLKLKVRTTWS